MSSFPPAPEPAALATDPVPNSIRKMHHWGFRSGQWAEILTTANDPEKGPCYIVRFPDGVTDFWVADDPDGQYEFRVTR